MCGPYGICKLVDQTICECPFGFTPKSPQDWNARQTSAGCVARKPLNCRAGEGFRKFKGLKLPDASYLNRTVASPAECEKACLSNCSCVAYANTDVSACVVWFGDLKDIRRYNEGGQVLHIRMAASELGKCLPWITQSYHYKTTVKSQYSIVSVFSYMVRLQEQENPGVSSDDGNFISSSVGFSGELVYNPNQSFSRDIGEEDLELPLFDLVTIKVATNNFSLANKIGQGGFGLVYKVISYHIFTGNCSMERKKWAYWLISTII
ncbi:unnamed protein product, partial [Vitis vinifera]